MSNTAKSRLLKAASIVISVGAPLSATISQFPIWIENSAEATLSGLFLVFALLSSLPIVRWYKTRGSTPSAAMVWLVLFIGLIALSRIIEQAIIVSCFGAISNIVGSGLYKWGEYYLKQNNKGAS